MLATHLLQIGFRVEMPNTCHLGKPTREVGSIVKDEITLLPILEVHVVLSAQLVLGTITAWAVDSPQRLGDRFPNVMARSSGIRAAVGSRRPRLMLLVPLTVLLRNLVDFDYREYGITLRTVKLGIALLYRTVREAWTFSDKASADAVVNVHHRDGLRNLMGVKPAESTVVAGPGVDVSRVKVLSVHRMPKGSDRLRAWRSRPIG